MPQNNVNTENSGATERHDVQSHSAPAPKKSNRGFASMDPNKQKEIASKGGRAAHAKGTAHQFTPDEAREAGRKGGGTVSQDRAHMAEIGRIGGMSRGAKRAAQRGSTGSEPPESGRGEDTATHTENEGSTARSHEAQKDYH